MGSSEEKVSKPYQVRLTDNALQNIDDITGYIAYINHQPLNAIRVGDAIFRSWIIMISYLSHDEKTVVFTAQSSFIKEWIEKNYSDQLLDIWKKFHPEAEKLIIQFKK